MKFSDLSPPATELTSTEIYHSNSKKTVLYNCHHNTQVLIAIIKTVGVFLASDGCVGQRSERTGAEQQKAHKLSYETTAHNEPKAATKSHYEEATCIYRFIQINKENVQKWVQISTRKALNLYFIDF